MSNADRMFGNVKAGFVLRINVEFKRECYLSFVTEDILCQKKKSTKRENYIMSIT